MYIAKILQMLDDSVIKLTEELRIIEPQINLNQDRMFITHDDHQFILVFAPIKYKAYIPKKYDCWKVKFVEWYRTDISEIEEYLNSNSEEINYDQY